MRSKNALEPFKVTLLEAVNEYVRCRELLLGLDLSVGAAVKGAVERELARRQSATLDSLLKQFLAEPETKKKSEFYLADLRKRWKRFAEHFGGKTLACDVSADDVRRWMNALPVADVTKGNFHRNVSAVYAYGVNIGLLPENVFRKVKKPSVKDDGGVDVFTPVQMRSLLVAAHAEWLPVLALAGFAGLRPEELRRLDWSEIDLEGGFIEVKASKSKTGKRRLVTISENLSAWLEPYKERKGGVVPANERKLRLAAMEAAKIERWPVDVLRHSFASYHLAEHTDMDATAIELGHTSTKTLFQHYREAVKADDAHKWWSLRPKVEGEAEGTATDAAAGKPKKGKKIIHLTRKQRATAA